MAADTAVRRTFLILLEEPHAWLAAATLARHAPPSAVETLIAPVPGVRFLSARGQEAAELNQWWARMATAPGRPIVLAAHEDELPGWIPGLDADFVVAVPDDATLAAYRGLTNVLATVDDDPRQLAELALRDPGEWSRPAPVREPAVRSAPGERPMTTAPTRSGARPAAGAAPVAGPPPAPPPPPVQPPAGPARRRYETAAADGGAPPRPAPGRGFEQPPSHLHPPVVDPFDLLARAEPIETRGAHNGAGQPAGPFAGEPPQVSRRTLLGDRPQGVTPPGEPRPRPSPAPARASFDPRQVLDRLGQARRPAVGAELGQAVLACKPLVTAVVSRKGGVGKTASAAAVAAILGEAVDPFGHTAALVDANVGNPDAWGRLDVEGEATTVREVVRSLMAGVEPPGPAFAETPALAIYPESRQAGDGYAPAQIQRVAGYLKGRHAAVVVDLPNRLPAFTSPEAAVAAAWIAEADVLILPTTADPTALLGAIEYLDADSVQGKPVIISYIVPRVRQIRDAPQVRGMLDRIRASVSAVVEVPDDDRATLALIRRVAITEIANELRQAYLDLAKRVVEAATRRNGDGG